jgi:hypothetical protein
MNARATAIQGGLAAAALVGAYLTWQRAPELAVGEVFAFDVTKNDLEKVRYADEEAKSWSEITRGKDANGSFVWLRMSGTDASNVQLPADP